MEISRRGFIGGVCAMFAAGLPGVVSISSGKEAAKGNVRGFFARFMYDRVYAAAFDEHYLRKGIGYLMGETDSGIVYVFRDGCGEKITGIYGEGGFFNKNVPTRHLDIIVDMLLDNFSHRINGSSYKHSTLFVRDKNVSSDGKDFYLNTIS